MATVFVVADSLTTEQVRRALVVHRHLVTEPGTPPSIVTSESKDGGGAFVNVEGPEAWGFRSCGLTPNQAARLASELARIA